MAVLYCGSFLRYPRFSWDISWISKSYFSILKNELLLFLFSILKIAVHPCFSSGSTVLFQIQEPLNSCTVLGKQFYTYYRLRNFGSLNIWDTHRLVDFFFYLLLFFPGRPVNVKCKYFQWSSITAIDININYFYCITIVS